MTDVRQPLRKQRTFTTGGASAGLLTPDQFGRLRDRLAEFSGVYLDLARLRLLENGLAQRLQATGDDLAAMAGLKNSFDPAGMFNPEKLFPKGYMCGEVRALRMQAMAQKHGIYAL